MFVPHWIPGGRTLHRLLSKAIFKKCDKLSCAGPMAFFGTGINLEMGDYNAIGERAHIEGDGGKIVIRNYVLMAPDVVILTSNHKYDNISVPITYQGATKENIEI